MQRMIFVAAVILLAGCNTSNDRISFGGNNAACTAQGIEPGTAAFEECSTSDTPSSFTPEDEFSRQEEMTGP